MEIQSYLPKKTCFPTDKPLWLSVLPANLRSEKWIQSAPGYGHHKERKSEFFVANCEKKADPRGVARGGGFWGDLPPPFSKWVASLKFLPDF